MATVQRKNRSRKKTKSDIHTHTLEFESRLMRSFIGKSDTLPDLINNHKVKVRFELSEDNQHVLFHITGKHPNQIEIVVDKFVKRYNKIVNITNNIITSLKGAEE